MQIYIDESGDDGQIKENGASAHYTLGLIALEKDSSEKVMGQISAELQKKHLDEVGYKLRTELSWQKLNDKSREIVAKNLLCRSEFIPIVITVDKFASNSGWSALKLNEAQFRTYVLRSLLWVASSSANLRSSKHIHLDFDKELADSFQKPISKEASRIKTKEIYIAAGLESKTSFGIQVADCLAGCFNHYRLGKSNLYDLFRNRVCEIELTASTTNGVPDLRLTMRINDLQKLMF